MRPNLALTAIDAVAVPHGYGHRCIDGRWHNPGAGTRTDCAVTVHLRTATEQVHRLDQQVHDAAHDDTAVRATVQGMTGFTDDDWTALGDEERDGWMLAGRLAIEALSAHLHRDLEAETRQAAIRARLTERGITGSPS